MEKFSIGEDLETDLLVTFLQNKKVFINYYEEIDPNYFVSDVNRKIFKIFKYYFQKYKHLPTANQVKSLIENLEKNSNINFIEHIEQIYKREELLEHEKNFLENELKNFIKRNKLKNAILESVDLLNNPENFLEIDSKIRKAILWQDNISLGTNMKNVEERYKKAEDMFKLIIPTHLPSLNKLLQGGFLNKTLTAIFAGSSMGKSIALDNFALHAFKLGFNVVEITLELSEEIKGLRIDSAILNKDIKTLLNDLGESQRVWSEFSNKKNKFFIKEFPPSTISCKHIENYLYKLEIYEDFKPDILFVDYAGLLLPNSGAKTSLYENGGAVMEELRGLAINYNIPVVTADQLKREAINLSVDEIDESMIADSDRKRRVIDNGIIIASTPEERQAGLSGWKIIKNRNGEKDKTFTVHVDYQYFKFYQKNN